MPSESKLTIGTRGSKLAMWQTEHVSEILKGAGIDVDIVEIKTTGDLNQSQSLHAIGTSGLFTRALDSALLNGSIDLAVHSCKDIPSQTPEGLSLTCILKRENPRDVLVALSPEVDFDNFGGQFVLGTSSLRRQAFLRHYVPHFEVKDIRGNLDTRLGKLKSGEYDGLILAYAGVKRMGYEQYIIRKLNASSFTPAPGQGAVAVMTRSDFSLNDRLRSVLNHEVSEIAILSERAFLRTLEGGCQVPIFALASILDGRVNLQGGVASVDGKVLIRDEVNGSAADPETLGVELAELIIQKGAREVLDGNAV